MEFVGAEKIAYLYGVQVGIAAISQCMTKVFEGEITAKEAGEVMTKVLVKVKEDMKNTPGGIAFLQKLNREIKKEKEE